MNIFKAFPDSDLQVYIADDILSESAMKLLTKLAQGKNPTGYRQDEIEAAIVQIRAASMAAVQKAYDVDSALLDTVPENKSWPWLDLHPGEERTVENHGVFVDSPVPGSYFTDFMVEHSIGGGEFTFKDGSLELKLAPGQMLVVSKVAGHEHAIKNIVAGDRFSLNTFIHTK